MSDNPFTTTPRTSAAASQTHATTSPFCDASRIVYKGTRRTQKKQYAFDLRPWCQFRHSEQQRGNIPRRVTCDDKNNTNTVLNKHFVSKIPPFSVAHACRRLCDWSWIGTLAKKAKTWVERTAVPVDPRATARAAWSLCRTDCLLFWRGMTKPAISRGKRGIVHNLLHSFREHTISIMFL